MCETRIGSARQFHRPVHCFSSPTPIQAYKLLAGQFGCVGCLSTLYPEELLTAAKTLVDSYPNDLNNSLLTRRADELCHFAKFADIFKDDEPGNISTELYKLIIYKSVHDTFPNVAIALRM